MVDTNVRCLVDIRQIDLFVGLWTDRFSSYDRC